MKAGRMLAVNRDAIREENDFYATDPAAIRIALPTMREIGLCTDIWEPACGQGHLSKALTENGYRVYSSDIVDHGYGDVQDFLTADMDWQGDILTNPPFKHAETFVRKSIELLKPQRRAWFFLKIQFLQAEQRKALFLKYPPQYVLIHSRRIFCAMGGNFSQYAKWDKTRQMWTGGTQTYVWIVWQKGWKGDTKIKWI